MELFRPLHLLIILLVAFIIFGLPLLVVLLLVRWLDKWQQRQPSARVSIAGVVIGGITDVVSSSILGVPLVIYVMVKFDLLHAPGGPAAITSAIHSTGWLHGLELTIGLVCSVLGGSCYVLSTANHPNCSAQFNWSTQKENKCQSL
jgi:hypothetical protein